MRITRRDFMKFCAMSAGALGLTTTQLGKLEKALATESTMGGTRVVWLNGAACTGCTVSFANTMYYSSVQDLLVPWAAAGLGATALAAGISNTGANGPLDLDFIETLSSAVGERALDAASDVLGKAAGNPFVLCIEGAIQTGAGGNYCTVGINQSTDAPLSTNIKKFASEVLEFADDDNCLAIVAVGTCASFGGIPAAKGSVTGARGLVSTGKITGGYQAVNTTGYWDYLKGTATYTSVASISVLNPGTLYASAPAVTIGGPPAGGVPATAHAVIGSGHVIEIVVDNPGSGYVSAPSVGIAAPGGLGTTATAQAYKGFTAGSGITTAQWNTLMGKTVCISGCPPHPDWLVGTIVYLLTYGEPPLMDKYHRPLDYYQEYQCTNCLWVTNNTSALGTTHDIDGDGKASKSGCVVGNSPKLFKYKYDSQYEGCIGVLGCKGRKTKADCSYRRWNTNHLGEGGVSWCVQTRAGCHGCTDPRFPDGWGKFFSFV